MKAVSGGGGARAGLSLTNSLLRIISNKKRFEDMIDHRSNAHSS